MVFSCSGRDALLKHLERTNRQSVSFDTCLRAAPSSRGRLVIPDYLKRRQIKRSRLRTNDTTVLREQTIIYCSEHPI